jgi:hypothetical protein
MRSGARVCIIEQIVCSTIRLHVIVYEIGKGDESWSIWGYLRFSA